MIYYYYVNIAERDYLKFQTILNILNIKFYKLKSFYVEDFSVYESRFILLSKDLNKVSQVKNLLKVYCDLIDRPYIFLNIHKIDNIHTFLYNDL